MALINTKCLYDKPEASDGIRILITRYWPRGKTFEGLGLDLYLSALAPSTRILKLYKEKGSVETNWAIYSEQYYEEMDLNVKAQRWIKFLIKLVEKGIKITLLCYEPEEDNCHRHLLKEIIMGGL